MSQDTIKIQMNTDHHLSAKETMLQVLDGVTIVHVDKMRGNSISINKSHTTWNEIVITINKQVHRRYPVSRIERAVEVYLSINPDFPHPR